MEQVPIRVRALAIIALLVTLPFTGGCLMHLNQALFERGEPYRAGLRELDAKKYDKAIALFEKVPAKSKDYQKARFAIGAAVAARGDKPQGLALMLRSRAIDPAAFDHAGNAQSLELLGDLYTAQVHEWSVELEDQVEGVVDAGAVVLVVTGQGVLTGIDKAKHAVAWEHTLGRRSGRFPRVVVAGTRAFAVRDRSGAYGKPALVAIDVRTGKLLWSRELGFDHPPSQPAVFGKQVFIGTGDGPRKDGKLLALSVDSGATLWSLGVPGIPGPVGVDEAHVCTQTSSKRVVCATRAGGRLVMGHDLGELAATHTLEVAHGHVYLSLRSAIYALDIAGGTLAWKRPVRPGYTTPLAVGDGTQLIVQGGSALESLAAASGQPAWAVEHVERSAARSIAPDDQPGLADGVVVGWSSGHVVAVRLDGTLVWRARFGGKSVTAAPVLDKDGKVYAAAGKKLHCLAPVAWASLAGAGAAK